MRGSRHLEPEQIAPPTLNLQQMCFAVSLNEKIERRRTNEFPFRSSRSRALQKRVPRRDQAQYHNAPRWSRNNGQHKSHEDDSPCQTLNTSRASANRPCSNRLSSSSGAAPFCLLPPLPGSGRRPSLYITEFITAPGSHSDSLCCYLSPSSWNDLKACEESQGWGKEKDA